MGAVRKVEKPNLFPGTTTWGKTQGPVVYVGALIADTDQVAGVHVFHDERESREIAHAWGWPTPEAHAEVVAALEEAHAEIEELREELAQSSGDAALADAINEGLKRVWEERNASVPGEPGVDGAIASDDPADEIAQVVPVPGNDPEPALASKKK